MEGNVKAGFLPTGGLGGRARLFDARSAGRVSSGSQGMVVFALPRSDASSGLFL